MSVSNKLWHDDVPHVEHAKPIDIHTNWPRQPPEHIDNIPYSAPRIPARKKLCPRYYNQCFKTRCNNDETCDPRI